MLVEKTSIYNDILIDPRATYKTQEIGIEKQTESAGSVVYFWRKYKYNN